MKIYRHSGEIPPQTGSSVAIGLFDGLHLGHRAVIGRAQQIARDTGVPAIVLSFDFADGSRPAGKPASGRLLSPERFELLLREIGIDALVRLPFSSIRDLSPESFAAEILSGCLGAKAVCCGENFHFGRGAGGSVRELAASGERLGFSAQLVPIVRYADEIVSSTRIRRCLEDGSIGDVNAMLGRPYTVDFPVVSGNRIGATLGMPTINQPFPEGYLIPRHGVYASIAEVDGKRYPAVTDVGVKPTVGGGTLAAETAVAAETAAAAETHIHGFEGDLYGRRVPVELLTYLRPEHKFENLEALSVQMRLDLKNALEITGAYLL